MLPTHKFNKKQILPFAYKLKRSHLLQLKCKYSKTSPTQERNISRPQIATSITGHCLRRLQHVQIIIKSIMLIFYYYISIGL